MIFYLLQLPKYFYFYKNQNSYVQNSTHARNPVAAHSF